MLVDVVRLEAVLFDDCLVNFITSSRMNEKGIIVESKIIDDMLERERDDTETLGVVDELFGGGGWLGAGWIGGRLMR